MKDYVLDIMAHKYWQGDTSDQELDDSSSESMSESSDSEVVQMDVNSDASGGESEGALDELDAESEEDLNEGMDIANEDMPESIPSAACQQESEVRQQADLPSCAYYEMTISDFMKEAIHISFIEAQDDEDSDVAGPAAPYVPEAARLNEQAVASSAADAYNENNLGKRKRDKGKQEAVSRRRQ